MDDLARAEIENVRNRLYLRVSPTIEIWSRREVSSTPSADYNSAALPLSYTGSRKRQLVPLPSKSQQGGDHLFGENPHQAAMQLECDA